MPHVSIIIPTYNRARLLRQALSSVTSQTFRDFQIIVVDDGSTDDTAAVCESMPDVRLVHLKHSGLPAVARNAGIAASDSELVAFLDSDDQWLPHKLVSQIAVFRENPCVGLACSDAVIEGPSAPSDRKTYHSASARYRRDSSFEVLLDDNFVIASTAIVRRSVLEHVGYFCEDAPLRGLEDYDLWLRVAATSPVIYMPEPLACYSYSHDGLSRQQSSADHWLGVLHIFNRLQGWSRLPVSARPAVESHIDRCWATLCNVYMLHGQYGRFGESFARYFWRSPVKAVSYVTSGIRKMQNR